MWRYWVASEDWRNELKMSGRRSGGREEEVEEDGEWAEEWAEVGEWLGGWEEGWLAPVLEAEAEAEAVVEPLWEGFVGEGVAINPGGDGLSCGDARVACNSLPRCCKIANESFPVWYIITASSRYINPAIALALSLSVSLSFTPSSPSDPSPRRISCSHSFLTNVLKPLEESYIPGRGLALAFSSQKWE